MKISDLQRTHVERQEEWCPDQKPDLSFRGNELGGECGEAQNVIKKLERERLGWRGSRDTFAHLGEELADVIHCAVLCAITAGIDLERAVVMKFNETSAKNGLATRISFPASPEEMRLENERLRGDKPEPEITHGLRMGDALLKEFYPNGKNIRRAVWPEGDHISTDGAEGGTIWYYDAEEDELTAGYRLSFHDLGASDWSVLP